MAITLKELPGVPGQNDPIDLYAAQLFQWVESPMYRIFGPIILLLCIGLGAPARAVEAASSDPIERALSVINKLDEANLFYQTIKTTVPVVLNPGISSEIKSQQISDAFNRIDQAAQNNSTQVLELFKKLNDIIDYKGKIREGFASPQITSTLNTQIEELNLTEFTRRLRDLSARLQQADPTLIKPRIHAAMEFLRFLVGLQEQTIFLATQGVGGKIQAAQIARGDIAHLMKQGNALFLLAKVFTQQKEGSEITPEMARQIAQSMNDLGLFYMKAIQTFSNTAAFDEDVLKEFKHFQDHLNPIPAEEVLATIKSEFGKDASELFVDFDASKPLASATIAQTYKAKIKTLFGLREVIIKVQRDGLSEELQRNHIANQIFLKGTRIFIPDDLFPLFDLITDQVVGLEKSIEQELDFRGEANRLRHFRALFRPTIGIDVPTVVNHLSGVRVLTMELMPGQNIETFVKGGQINSQIREKLFTRLMDATLYQVIFKGQMHADMHPGNLLATEDGKIALLDWGQTVNTRGFLGQPVRFFWNLFMGDAHGAARAFGEMGQDPRFDYAKFEKDLSALMAEHKLDARGMKDFFSGYFFNDDSERVERIMEILGKILPRSQKDYHFVPTPRYLQMARGLIPVVSSLYTIGKDIDSKRLIRIVAWRLLTFFPLGTLKYVASLPLLGYEKIKREGKQAIGSAFQSCGLAMQSLGERWTD